jgi:hypothetical protein
VRSRDDRAIADDVLTDRQLNRATLARQLLLERAACGVADTVTRLVGMQAQEPKNPYVALWSRLRDFDPDQLEALLLDREVVRIVCLRGTIHLVTADDALVLRPLCQPVLDAELTRHPEVKPVLATGVDLEPVLAFARELLAEAGPRTQAQIRAAMAERFPDLHAPGLAYVVRNRLPMVQVPPRGMWHRSGQVVSTTTDLWLGRPLADVSPAVEDAVVLRYLAAFGPATVADVATWSRLTKQRAILERLRGAHAVVTFRDGKGRELFDVPGAPRPDGDTPAPPRFLPEYDNVLLSHTDRSRFAHPAGGPPIGGERFAGTALVDGAVAATWARGADGELVVDHVALPNRDRAALEREAHELAAFAGASDVVLRTAPQ